MIKRVFILTVPLFLAVLTALGNPPVSQSPLAQTGAETVCTKTGGTGCPADSLSGQSRQSEQPEQPEHPEPSEQSQLLYFRFDRSLVDSGYRNNGEVLARLQELFSDNRIVERIDSIRIRAYASPDGNADYNRRLALRRARAVKGYFVWKYPNLNQYRIRTSSHAENWEVLRTAIENDRRIPYREDVLQILARPLSSERKEALLKELHGGTVYSYIFRHILPDLRNASICTVYVRPMMHPASACPTALNITGFQSLSSADFPAFCHSERKRRIPSPMYAEGTDSSLPLRMTGDSIVGKYSSETKGGNSAYDNYLTEMYRLHPRRVPLFAVKTNLLFDVAMMPNIEVELPIGKRYSLNGELMFPWWLYDGDKYCLQILMGGLEGRYWLGKRDNREVLTGHFLGLYAGGGKYDLQWDRNGYQGEFFIAAGISYGYAHKIARNLRLEYSLGIGLLRTNYEHYHTLDNYQTLLWQNNGRYTWLGPTKLKVSLVWLLTRKAKLQKGGKR